MICQYTYEFISGFPGEKGSFGEKGLPGDETYGRNSLYFFLIKKIISLILGPRGNNGLPGRTGRMFLMSSDLK